MMMDKCGQCGSENTHRGEPVWNDAGVFNPCDCDDCGATTLIDDWVPSDSITDWDQVATDIEYLRAMKTPPTATGKPLLAKGE